MISAPSSSLQPPSLLYPAADVFAQRAERFRHLATGHSLASWLTWLAALCHAQQHALDTRKATPHGENLLDDAFGIIRPLAATLDQSPALAGLDDAALRTKLQSAYQYACEITPIANWNIADLFAAAALQVAGTHRALQQTPADIPQSAHCPCCGAAPVGGILMAGDGKAGVRYLECSLCASRWHAVRARCTLCDSSGVVNYLGLQGHHPAVQAETCDTCHGYIKLYSQLKDIQVDPVADDLATLALDVLVGEQGFARGAPNLLLYEGEAVLAH